MGHQTRHQGRWNSLAHFEEHSSASVHACTVAPIKADSAKTMAAETAAAWWPYNERGDEREVP
jgi:hypothetical protein